MYWEKLDFIRSKSNQHNDLRNMISSQKGAIYLIDCTISTIQTLWRITAVSGVIAANGSAMGISAIDKANAHTTTHPPTRRGTDSCTSSPHPWGCKHPSPGRGWTRRGKSSGHSGCLPSLGVERGALTLYKKVFSGISGNKTQPRGYRERGR